MMPINANNIPIYNMPINANNIYNEKNWNKMVTSCPGFWLQSPIITNFFFSNLEKLQVREGSKKEFNDIAIF
jgi:hypothetical protein